MLQHNGSSGEKNTMGKQWYLLATILLRQTMRSGSVPAGWWLTYPSEKYESQLGWFFPLYGKIIQMFQTFPNHQPEWVLQIFWGKTHHVACRSWFHLRCHARLQRGITTRAMRMGHINDALLLLSLSPRTIWLWAFDRLTYRDDWKMGHIGHFKGNVMINQWIWGMETVWSMHGVVDRESPS